MLTPKSSPLWWGVKKFTIYTISNFVIINTVVLEKKTLLKHEEQCKMTDANSQQQVT